jgi:hypothetical protein
MESNKHTLIFTVVLTIITILLGIYYLGVANPELLPKNAVFAEIVPWAFNYELELRWIFMATFIFYSLINEANEMIGDKIGRDVKKKIGVCAIFLIAAFTFSQVHNFPYTAYVIFYPFSFLVFSATAFILPNLFKKKEILVKNAFDFQPTLIELEAQYPFYYYGVYKGQKCVINILNPFRGIIGIGGAGAGKTYNLVEPIIEQSIKMGFTGLWFDFKMNGNFSKIKKEWAISRYIVKCMIKYSQGVAERDENGKWKHEQSLQHDRRKVWFLNFVDPRYSHQVNPIHPSYLKDQAFANELAMVLLQNLKPEWIAKKDFFADGAIQIWKAITWFLCKMEPDYCTIPHAVSIALLPSSKLIAALSYFEDTREILSSLTEAQKGNAGQQLAGVVSSLKTPIDLLNNPALFLALRKNDFNLALNDPENPGILCLGSDPALQETYSPVCALIATVVKKLMNAPSRLPSMFAIDEAAQIVVPKLDDLPATGRQNQICTALWLQDVSQMEQKYTEKVTESLIANLNNQFFGQVGNLKTMEAVSKIIGTREKENVSINSSKSMSTSMSKTSGDNTSIQRENLIHPHEVGSLKMGEFVGKLSYMPDGYDPYFRIEMKPEKFDIDFNLKPILTHPDGTEISNEEMDVVLHENYNSIKRDAQMMIVEYARQACIKGLADETQVFPGNFVKKGETLIRIVGQDGQPKISSIKVNELTGDIIGEPDMNEVNALAAEIAA